MIRDQEATAYTSFQNSFLRRSSPPGSPAIKKCCYEHGEGKYAAPAEPSFFCCCYSCTGSKSTSFLTTLGVCFLVLAYTILGAFVFMALEGGFYQDGTKMAASKGAVADDGDVFKKLRSETVDKLWSITENLNILYRENWTRLAAEEVLMFQDELFKVKESEGSGSYAGSRIGTMAYYQKNHKWSFSSSFLYSLTLITTIGLSAVDRQPAFWHIP
ncbi:uncharacterized protein LOC126888665 [Diabrotica virgifera virgifera]|uniref:TWiK family of potassium channels protein 18-like n=1 Tax=Diabrotica virgifera virgifera TaxID=50390 RepID=A0ABM5KS24_DIAVI|nr:uncharacterized protein LOC126888665 [Diabrotica virgifera virgifera]